MTTRFQLKSGVDPKVTSGTVNYQGTLVTTASSAYWTQSVNPVLAAGEIGVEPDTRKLKIGDGTTAWSSLNYAQGTQGTSGSNGTQGAQGGVQTIFYLQQPISSYTITSADIGSSIETGVQYITLNNSGSVGSFVKIYNTSIGIQVTIQGGTGVTVQSTGATQTAPKIKGMYYSATAIKVVSGASARWIVTGDII